MVEQFCIRIVVVVAQIYTCVKVIDYTSNEKSQFYYMILKINIINTVGIYFSVSDPE